MARLTEVVEGWTGALPFTLNADNVPVDLTGMTIHVILRHNDGTLALDSSSGLSFASSNDTTGGTVTYTPSSTGFFLAAKTPYSIRFRVTDALSKKVYFPNADADIIKVNV